MFLAAWLVTRAWVPKSDSRTMFLQAPLFAILITPEIQILIDCVRRRVKDIFVRNSLKLDFLSSAFRRPRWSEHFQKHVLILLSCCVKTLAEKVNIIFGWTVNGLA